jgi:replicative DNA helicase
MTMTHSQSIINKPLPNDTDVERTVLGNVFWDNALFLEASTLQPADFYDPIHRLVFTAMIDLSNRSEPINPVTVVSELRKTNPGVQLTAGELANWNNGIPFATSLALYISKLRDKTLKRQIIRRCDNLATRASDDTELGADLASEAVTTFQDDFSASNPDRQPTVGLSEGLSIAFERWEKMLRREIVTIETGISEVDHQLTGGGFEKGMFHVIGARPGKGKTSFALDIASHNILQDKVVVFFTLELSRDVLLERLVAPLAGVKRWEISARYMHSQTMKRLAAVKEFIQERPLFVNAKARSLQDMRIALKTVQRLTGGRIDVVIVDFLTKMRLNRQSKYEGVSENANGLAEFAGEFDAAVLCLAQLNRSVTKRTADRPEEIGKVETTDFRDSGEIEELARTIIALWGNSKEIPFSPVNVSCIKQGEGKLFDHEAVFDTDYMTFGVRQCLIQNR